MESSVIYEYICERLRTIMTNIEKYQALYDMHSHKAQEVAELFDEHLEYGYSNSIKKLAKEQQLEVSNETIRKVRIGLVQNLEIFNLLISHAKKNKTSVSAAKEEMAILLQN